MHTSTVNKWERHMRFKKLAEILLRPTVCLEYILLPASLLFFFFSFWIVTQSLILYVWMCNTSWPLCTDVLYRAGSLSFHLSSATTWSSHQPPVMLRDQQDKWGRWQMAPALQLKCVCVWEHMVVLPQANETADRIMPYRPLEERFHQCSF